jgi:hypothetical protein
VAHNPELSGRYEMWHQYKWNRRAVEDDVVFVQPTLQIGFNLCAPVAEL